MIDASPQVRRFSMPCAVRAILIGLAVITTLASGADAPALADPGALPQRSLEILVVIGEPGSEEYRTAFNEQAEAWRRLAKDARASIHVIGADDSDTRDRDQLQRHLEAASASLDAPLWLILIGHGTFDGRDARFNLRGDDLTPADLASWLGDSARDLVLIHTGSASGAFMQPLSAQNRVLLTATKSADEFWATRFGSHFVEALRPETPGADQDQDGQVSLLEAWLLAASRVANSYEEEGRIATEHSLLDDNGDGRGSRSETFTHLKPTAPADGSSPDGQRAHQHVLLLSPEEARLTEKQRAQRNAIETQIQALNDQRAATAPAVFYQKLEPLLLQLAELYAAP